MPEREREKERETLSWHCRSTAIVVALSWHCCIITVVELSVMSCQCLGIVVALPLFSACSCGTVVTLRGHSHSTKFAALSKFFIIS